MFVLLYEAWGTAQDKRECRAAGNDQADAGHSRGKGTLHPSTPEAFSEVINMVGGFIYPIWKQQLVNRSCG